MGTPAAGGRSGGASTGFPLSKSKIFYQVFIKFGEYGYVHNVSTKFYNQTNPPSTPELWPFNCPKLGFTLCKSKSFVLCLLNLLNMLLGIIYRPSSITSQISPCP